MIKIIRKTKEDDSKQSTFKQNTGLALTASVLRISNRYSSKMFLNSFSLDFSPVIFISALENHENFTLLLTLNHVCQTQAWHVTLFHCIILAHCEIEFDTPALNEQRLYCEANFKK